MRVPVSWLAELVELPTDLEALASRLTFAGLEVTGIEQVGGDWRGVTVGHVLEVVRHPNADRLRLVSVDTGAGTRTVVCGAPNVAPGQNIAFADRGAVLKDPRTGKDRVLKKSRIRGVVSGGMVCSEAELGLSDEHAGILVLDTERAPGTPLREVLGDRVLVFDLTPNRADALSVLGVAREVAALIGGSLVPPRTEARRSGSSIAGRAAAEVRAPDLCPRFTLALIEDVQVGPSPKWMQERLLAAGMRPINNLVDITNYVMLEFGQPVHAFDYDTVRDHRILVRRAEPGETLTTLDGHRRELDPENLVIADPGGPIALAGVMGGEETEITASTRNVLLEVANFEPVSVRRTARAFDLFSDAARRFAWGLPAELAPLASSRVCRLLAEHAGGRVAEGIVDVWSGPEARVRIRLERSRIPQVLGIPVRQRTMEEALVRLGFGIERKDRAALRVRVPAWRRDVRVPDDLVEEVARYLGYDDLPPEPLNGPIPHHPPLPARHLRERVKDLAAGAGLFEVQTYSLVARAELDRVVPPAEGAGEPARVRNPLGKARDTLRTSLRPGILGAAARNLNRGEPTVALFEVGRIYCPVFDGADGRPKEVEHAAGIVGGVRTDRFGTPTAEPLDFFDAKASVERVLSGLRIEASFRPARRFGFLDGRTAAIRAGAETIGLLGQVHPTTAEAFDIEQEVFVWELDLTRVGRAAGEVTAPAAVRRLPKYPAASEDFAFVVRGETLAQDLVRVARNHPLVVEARVFDDYRLRVRDGYPPGSRSIGIAVRYRAPNRTLRERDIAKVRRTILKRLRAMHGAVVRGSDR